MDANAEEVVVTGLEVDPAKLAEMIAGDEVQVIDVRRDYEHDAGHIPGARHVEINELTAQAESIEKDRPVVFYCRGGSRSAMAAEAYAQAGYDSHNLAGGILAWVELENPLEPDDGNVAEQKPV